jgi:hypothetical protein
MSRKLGSAHRAEPLELDRDRQFPELSDPHLRPRAHLPTHHDKVRASQGTIAGRILFSRVGKLGRGAQFGRALESSAVTA